MKIALLVFTLLVSQNTLITADENPFIEGGVPASTREWHGKDYIDTFNAIVSGKAPLPKIKDKYGKQIIERLTNPENFALNRNKNLPIHLRINDSTQIQQGLNAIIKLYVQQSRQGKDVHAEMAKLLAFSLRVAALEIELINEFVPTLPKDETYEYRMQALKDTYGGITTIFAGVEGCLDETNFYSKEDLTTILEAMNATLPKLKQAFSPEYHQELRVKFKKRLKDANTQDGKLLESMISSLPSTPTPQENPDHPARQPKSKDGVKHEPESKVRAR